MSNIDAGKLWEQFELMESRLHHTEYSDEARQLRIYWMKRIRDEKLTAVERHSAWCSNLYAQGWRPGEKMNALEKTHPHLVPWMALPDETREELFDFVVFAYQAGEIIESLQEPAA